MIVCHCQGISDHHIRAAVDWMRAADPATIITPGKRADCGGCMPHFLDTMRRSAGFSGLATTTTAPRLRFRLLPAKTGNRYDAGAPVETSCFGPGLA